jgi:hypothetical protein
MRAVGQVGGRLLVLGLLGGLDFGVAHGDVRGVAEIYR